MNDKELRRVLSDYKRIAIVGLSAKESRASHRVARFMLEKGYEVIPVNPGYEEVLGLRCYPALEDVPGPIDIVDLFQRSENVPPFVDQAIAIGARLVWMQLDVIHEESAQRARDAGLEVVMDRCPKIEYERLM
ncbi:MAG: CoA-binding protein [Pseudomonadales bacterium]